MGIREWLLGGIPDMEQQRDDHFANYHQTIGALRAIEAIVRWLDENEGAGTKAPPISGETDDNETHVPGGAAI